MSSISTVIRRDSFVFAIFLSAFVYLLLVFGGVLPFSDEDSLKPIMKGVMLVGFILLFCFVDFRRKSVESLLLFSAAGLFFGVLLLVRASNFEFAVEKIDGAIVCSCIVALLLDHGYRRFGRERFQFAFVIFSVFVLILTVVYKIRFGFFDRSTRFFLNGPIVYGWIMGLCAILSFDLWSSRRHSYLLFLSFGFFLALIWTESKGSVLAFLLAMCVYLLWDLRRNIKSIVFVFCFLFCVFFLFSDVLMDMLSNSRLAAVGRFLNGDLGGADEGSFGVRSILAEKATQEFWDNPIFGIGIGEFRFGEYVYPHNQHLEIFAELGVFFGIAHLLFVFSSFVVASRVNKAIILLFAVAASFSGDASYLRFLYSFCLIGYLGREPVSRGQVREA